MKKRYLNWTLVILAIFLSILGFSMSVLALTTSYDVFKIRGQAQVDGASWDVHFENLSAANMGGSAKDFLASTTYNGTTIISSFRVLFSSEGDTASYTIDVVNAGVIDAVITDITTTEPVCSGSGDNAIADSKLVCSNFKYEVTYLDDSDVEYGDILPKGGRATLKVKMWYDGPEWPDRTVYVDDLTTKIIYTQK